MESGSVIAEEGWGSLDLSSQAESEMMEQLLGIFPSIGEEYRRELPLSAQASNACYIQCNASSSAYKSTSSYSVGNFILNAPSEYEGFYLSDSNEGLRISSCTATLDLNMVQEQGATQFMDAILNPSYGNAESSCEDVGDRLSSIDTCKKRKRQKQSKLDDQTRSRKCSRKYALKQTNKAMQRGIEEDGSIAVTNEQSLSCCMSENDSTASQEPPFATDSNDKAQAIQRSAIDAQSLYAKKRRERINTRLKILQNLVPNGTKVDISTMLEEAVHYVKFLQLQIKLLSSDKMWMYAPIAYNGMNIGIDLNLSQH